MSNLNIVARLTVKRECIESVKSELLKLIEPTRNEAGCITYMLHQDNEHPDIFIFYETWENHACFENHMNTEHFKRYVAAVASMIEDKTVHKMTRIA